MKNCKTCKYWHLTDGSEFYPPPHKDFNFCSGITISEGEMHDVKYGMHLPSEYTDIVINTSEWFQDFQTHKSFGCNKWEKKQ